MDYHGRVEGVRKALSDEAADVFILSNAKNVLYLTGFEGGELLIPLDSDPILFVSTLSFEEAEEKAEGVCLNRVDIGCDIKNLIMDTLKGWNVSTVLYDELKLSEYKAFESAGFRVKDGSTYVVNLRRVKDPEELKLIREACKLTGELMELLISVAKPGMTECELAKEADIFLRDRGLEHAFPIIVVSGSKTSNPHGKPSLKRLVEGEPVTIDVGVRYMGYCSDMTRSFILGENPEYERLLRDVEEAQRRALREIKARVSCKLVDRVARSFLDDKGYGGLFLHSLGHGVGLDIHEPPTLNPASKDTLIKGDVITVEPGVYIKRRFGCRVEDTVLVHENRCEKLT